MARSNTQQGSRSQQEAAVARAVEEALAQQAERMAQLEAELEEARKRPARQPREKKPTAKQAKFLAYFQEHPDQDVASICREIGAGGKTEPHGFLWRLVVDGYLQVSIPQPTESAAESAEVLEEGTEQSGTEVSAAAQGV